MSPLQSIQSAAGRHDTGASLNRTLGEFIGGVFVEPVMKQALQGPFHTKYFDGGRGEEAFRGQLAGELSRRIGRVMASDFGRNLSAALERRMGASAAAIPNIGPEA